MTALDRETLTAAVREAMGCRQHSDVDDLTNEAFSTCEEHFDEWPCPASERVVDAVLALTPPPDAGEAGEAAERVAAFARDADAHGLNLAGARVYRSGDDRLGFSHAIAADLRLLLADRDRLLRERDEARDLAFRAAFGPEEGGQTEYAVVYVHADGREERPTPASSEAVAAQMRRAWSDGARRYPVSREVGPWREMPDGGDES